jgi:hypothetical protein
VISRHLIAPEPAMVIVNESMARWLRPGKNAIGKRIRVGRPEDQARRPLLRRQEVRRLTPLAEERKR